MDQINVMLDGRLFVVRRGILLSALTVESAAFDMPCGGRGSCGKCRVIARGDLSPMSQRERELLSDRDIARGVRLACMTEAMGDCQVQTGAPQSESVALEGDASLSVAAAPMLEKYGVAVDIGTTTLAAALYDNRGRLLGKEGVRNPQRSFGADVISRIEASMKGESEALARSVCKALEECVCRLAERCSVLPLDIDAMVIVGNTAMLSLACGTDVSPLSRAPFVPNRLFGEYIGAGELGFTSFSENVKIYMPPCISGYIGADTVAALLASGIVGEGSTRMLCDIGTNGEIALWHEGELCCASTAAGPAFEGAGISSGSTALTGAVSSVQIVNGALLAKVIGGGAARSICGSGIIDAVACLLALGELDETGYLEDGVAVIAEGVTLDQKDMRAVQLAKSAIHAGMRTLARTAGLNMSDIEELLIAGGFGSFIIVNNAAAIGLLPSELKGRVKVLGNAALQGAGMILLDMGQIEKCRDIAERARVVELSANPVFTDEYMDRMLFCEG